MIFPIGNTQINTKYVKSFQVKQYDGEVYCYMIIEQKNLKKHKLNSVNVDTLYFGHENAEGTKEGEALVKIKLNDPNPEHYAEGLLNYLRFN